MAVKVKFFKVFRIDSASMKWPLFWGFGSLLPQILFDLAEILTRGKKIKRGKKTVFEKCFKILNFGSNGKQQFWSILGPNLPPENHKYCLKPKFLQKLHP